MSVCFVHKGVPLNKNGLCLYKALYRTYCTKLYTTKDGLPGNIKVSFAYKELLINFEYMALYTKWYTINERWYQLYKERSGL